MDMIKTVCFWSSRRKETRGKTRPL